MSAITAPAPSSVETPTPPKTDAVAHRTVLGFVATRRIVEIILTLILGIGGALLLFGSNFRLNMVHTQLADQGVSFPAKGSPALNPAEFPDLQRYAGQKVDTGPKAKAYANGFINRHLAAVAGGKTYSQVSTLSQADPTNATLTAQVATLFK